LVKLLDLILIELILLLKQHFLFY